MSVQAASASSSATDVPIAEATETKVEKGPKTFTARAVSPSKPYAAVTGAKEPLALATPTTADVSTESSNGTTLAKSQPAKAKPTSADGKVRCELIPRLV